MPLPSTSYDELAYPSYAFPLTHPDNMATIAHLFGLSPPPVEQCRVLELGCAGAGNLIPMASCLPNSSFVGVDLSTRQIASGQDVVDALQLTNIDLRTLDFTAIGPDFGRFDYIICHGVFSWVGESAQEHILSICRRNLADDGIAYLSYNVYPGWHEGQMLRDILQYHCRDGGSPVEKVKRARRFIEQLGTLITMDDDTRAAFLRPELQHLSRPDKDAYLFSEYLADENSPLHFQELVARARAHEMQYLGNADSMTMWVDNQPEPIADAMKRCPTVFAAQQMLDFQSNRRFRSTLLCHAVHTVDMNLRPERIYRLRVRASVRPDPANGDLQSLDPVAIKTPGGSVAWITGAANRLALSLLTRAAPAAIGFEELASEVTRRLATLGIRSITAETREQFRSDLAATLTRLYFADIVHFHSYQANLASELSTRPRATKLARLEAANSGIATTQWHGRYYLSPLHRAVLRQLNGSANRSELTSAIDENCFDDTTSSPRDEQVADVLSDLHVGGLLVA